MSEQIGNLYGTQVPALSDVADIQEAFRIYHYGAASGTASGQYDITNSNVANLVPNSMAYFLHNLQTQINSIAGISSVPLTAYNNKGVILSGVSSGGYERVSVGSDGFVLTANSGSTTGVSWSAPSVTPTNEVTLTNKTLTSPVINVSFNKQTDSYTLALSDNGKIVEIDSTTTKYLTVPKNSSVAFPNGASITISQTNVGQIIVQGVDVDVTVNGSPGLKIRDRWSSATLIKRDTNTWQLIGDLSA